MKQANDYAIEAKTLSAILAPLDDQAFSKPTLFKGWTINDVIGHLYMFDHAALLTLEDTDRFHKFIVPVEQALKAGKSLLEVQIPWLGDLTGPRLFEAWNAQSEKLEAAYGATDPKARLSWVGPDMSARSSITARQMETWAHGQEVFDVLGLERDEGDHIQNICHLGVATCGWTFSNRKLPIPENPPAVTLTAPSGAIWKWNEENTKDCITGSAVDFARVVTQTRNIKDTSLEVQGPTAATWMHYAQCFAGPPNDPPPAGSRYRAT